MPRQQQMTHVLVMTEPEQRLVDYALKCTDYSDMPRRSGGHATRLLRRLCPIDREPNIQRMLDVSTGHLTEVERIELSFERLPCQIVATDHGGILYSSGFDDVCEMPYGASPTLIAIMRHAIAQGCGYVMFDADAPHLPGFPVFEAEEV